MDYATDDVKSLLYESKVYHMGLSFPLFQIYKMMFLLVSQVLLGVLVLPSVIVTILS